MRRTSPTAHHAARFVRLLALGALSLAAAGCRTFNYTDADLDEERRLLAEREGLVQCPLSPLKYNRPF
jgi:hypothetical protein